MNIKASYGFGKFAGTIISFESSNPNQLLQIILEVHKVYNFIVKELTRQEMIYVYNACDDIIKNSPDLLPPLTDTFERVLQRHWIWI